VLEAIHELEAQTPLGYARVKDIAARLKVKPSTVTIALRRLKKMGLVHYERYRGVKLTTRGRRHARRLVRTHQLLAEFFEKVLGLDSEEADENACRVEHVLSQQAIERLAAFLDEYLRSQKPNQAPN